MPIDTTLSQNASGWWQSGVNTWQASFGPSSAVDPIQINLGAKGTVSFTPVGAASVAPAAGSAPNQIIYKSLWTDTDATETVGAAGVQESLILHAQDSPTTYKFDLTGATATMDRSGDEAWLAVSAQRVAEVPRPTVVLADGTYAPGSAAALSVTTSGGSTQLVFKVDPTWMAGLPAAEFPLTVDPDVYFSPGAGGNTYSESSCGTVANNIQVGTDSSGCIWRAVVHYSYENYLGANPPNQALNPAIQLTDQTGSSAGAQTVTAYPILTTPSPGAVAFNALLSEGGQVGSASDPGTLFNLSLAQSSFDTWLMQNQAGWGFVLTGNETSTGTLKIFAPTANLGATDINSQIEAPPPRSQITSIASGAVLATTSPTLTATAVISQYGDTVWYDFQVFPKGGGGAVVDSGWQHTNNPTTYNVPAGSLADGAAYIATISTSTLPYVMVPQAPVQVPFTVKLGLGSGGPSPTDTVGTAPGATSVPSAGAPSPGTPAASVTVNMVTGNLSVSAANHSLQTVSGPLNVSFAYNTQYQNKLGLTAQYFYDTGDHAYSSQDYLVGQRTDQSVDFNWNYTPPIGSLPADDAFLVRWSGYINMATAGSWAFGVASGGGMQVLFNNSPTPEVSTWTAGGGTAANPVYGTTISVPSAGWYPIAIQAWEPPADSGQASAQLWLQNQNVSPPVSYLGLPGDYSNQPVSLPNGWQLSPDSGQVGFTHLVDDGGQVLVYASDGSAIGFTANGTATGGFTPQQGVTDNLTFVSNPTTHTQNYVLSTSDNQTYTFDISGNLTALSSSADHLLHPAALQYAYNPSAGPGSSLVLASITDPVSNRAVTLTYTPNSGCSEPQGVPTGLLCQISYWDGTTTQVGYNTAGQLVQITNPGNEVSQFAYNSAGQLYEIRDPLAYDAVAYGARTDDSTTYTTIAYNSAGEVTSVTSPAPQANQAQPQRTYNYNPAARTTTMSIAGFNPASGFAKQVTYDTQNRVTSETDSTGTHTTSTIWDNNNNPIVTIAPGGTLAGPSSLAANSSATYTWNMTAASGQQAVLLSVGSSAGSTSTSTAAAYYNTGPSTPLTVTGLSIGGLSAATAPGPTVTAGNYSGSATLHNNGTTTLTAITAGYPGGSLSGPTTLAANTSGTYTWTATTAGGYPAVPLSFSATAGSSQVNGVAVAYYTTQSAAPPLTLSNEIIHSSAANTSPGPALSAQTTYSGTVTIANNTSSTITGVTASFPGGEQTTSVYNTQNLLTDTYGPAPQPCFNPPNATSNPNLPVTAPTATAACGVSVPHTNTVYDGGIIGAKATYWANPNLAGPVVAYATGTGDPTATFTLTDADLASLSNITGTSGGWSAQYAGYINIPTTGAYDLTTTTTQQAALYVDGANPEPASGTPGGGYGTPAGEILQLTAGTHSLRVDYISTVSADNGLIVGYSPYTYGQSQDNVAAIPDTMIDPGYGLATQTTDADGKVTTTSYTNPSQHIGPQYGLATSVTQDPNGLNLTTTTSYEDPTQGGYLRETATTLPAGNTTTDTYYINTADSPANACGVTTSTPQGGLLAQQTGPSPGGSGQPLEKQFIYTSAGQQAGMRSGPANNINNAGWVCTYYDIRGRIAQQTWPAQNDGTARTVTYSYGSGGGSDDTLTNPLQAKVADSTGTIQANVDLLGRPTSYTDVWGQSTTVTYNQAGQVTTSTGPAGTISTGYDPNSGQPTTTTVNSTLMATASYDPTTGAMNSVTYGNSTNAAISYDSYGHQNNLTYTNNTSSTIATDSATYNQAGRQATETTTDAQGPLTVNYTYDAAGRLTAASDPGRNQTSTYSYAQNPAGDNCTAAGGNNNGGENTNRTSVTTPAGTTDYCYNSADQLVSTITAGTTNSNYSYNSLDDQTNDGGITYSWDSSNRPLTATATAGTTTSTYDAVDRLVQSANTNSTVRYSYAGYTTSPAAILNTSNQIIQQLIALPGGVTVTLQTTGNTWSYTNLQGDTTATANQAGSLTAGPVTYDPWGALNAGQTGPVNITGPNTQGAYASSARLTNTTTGTILLGARTMNPAEARFLSLDPIDGGCANPYTYSFGDPLNHPDLTGQGGCHKHHHSSFLGTLGAIVGGAAAVVGLVAFSLATLGIGDVLAAAAATLGVASTVLDAISCAKSRGEEVTTCAGAVLGALGTAGAVAAFGKLGEEALKTLSSGRAFFIGGTVIMAGAGGVTDAVSEFKPPAPCHG